MFSAAIKSGAAAASAPVDAQFNYVTMLLHGDGTNGAQNNTFLDSSTNNFTITRNGNTTQGSFSPYGQGWSNYFVSGYPYLSFPTNAGYNFGTGDFTVEFWFYSDSIGDYARFISNDVYYASGIDIFWHSTGIGWSISSTEYKTSSAVSLGAWHHIAFSRSGTTLRVFVDGTLSNTFTGMSANITSSNSLIVGGYYNGTSTLDNDYMSNVRLVKGTALYTSSFTPSTTPLTAVTNTTLLTCQSNRFIDNSATPATATVNGVVSVQRFNPFGTSTAYSTATIGGSGYFDGSGDYLSAASNAAFAAGTGDFAVQCWVYFTNISAGILAICQSDAVGTSSSDKFWVGIQSGTLKLAQHGTANAATSPLSPVANQWYNIAVSRVSGTVYMWINGVSQTVTNSTVFSSTSFSQNGFVVGAMSTPYYMSGYMTGFQYQVGTGFSSYTLPTSPIAAGTNAKLLLEYTNSGIVDNAMMNDLETVGNAQISTSVVKYGTGSIAFDGNGDYLVSNSATTDLYAFGTGDFTIEMWVYLANTTGTKILYDCRPSTSTTYQPLIYISGANAIYNTNSADRITGTSAMSATTWQHLAVCRSGTSTKLFVNGVQVGSTYSDSNTYTCPANRPWIGAESVSGGTGYMNGYIDDLRITKGYARYTTNFTPPTAALPNIGPVSS